MNQVLQRTRPSADASQPTPKFRTVLRSFLSGKRGLLLLAIVGGTAVSSSVLHGLLRPASQPAPGTPMGSEGRKQSASTVEPTASPPPAAAKPAASLPAAGRPVAALPAPSMPAVGISSEQATPGQGAFEAQVGAVMPPPPRAMAAPRSGVRVEAPARPRATSLPPQASLGRQRPARGRLDGGGGQGLISRSGSGAFPGPVPATPAAVSPARSTPKESDVQAALPQVGSGYRSDLDPFQGVPCSDTTAALPSDQPSEEAWLLGIDASSALTALDPIPLPPIDSESPELAAGSSSPLPLQATRNTPCLLKQPAGRN